MKEYNKQIKTYRESFFDPFKFFELFGNSEFLFLFKIRWFNDTFGKIFCGITELFKKSIPKKSSSLWDK